MERRKRTRQVEATRQRIISAALPLLSQRQFEVVSMDDIARAASVSRPTLYNHFNDKAAILDACFADEFAAGAQEMLCQAMELSSLRERLAFVFDDFAKWAAPKKSLLLPVISHSIRQSLALPCKAHPLQAFFAAVIGKPRSEVNDHRHNEILAHYLQHLYLGATLRWLMSDEPGPENFFSEMLSLFLDGAESKRGAT